ncbi:MAG: PAS domain S-box protein [Gemmatimonadetes bacterium]|jgi:PAS domain S-box-containing protein|nr:PAS domain S-box protein [Gemmatimonadota bacterium]MBT4612203.1 PAS domain S-box protein [Gemmatimonadota bacterium]MBT5058561.1 PAS domain S-box protein [Gemmatimonadota bacterium]MBT5141123.1 PAS domain S-box protein [Gemmatimonadota bacterium]MBT5591942.1 PAS domain S-box protein [Gemmatimonadota bacterium]
MTDEPERHELLEEVRALRRELAETHPASAEGKVRFQSVVDNVIDGIITIDEEGIIESFNPAAARIFGYDSSEVIGKPVQVLMPEPYATEHDGYMHSYKETGHRRIIGIGREVRGRRKDGHEFPMDLSVGEFREDGVRKFTGVVRDVTERKHLELQLLQAQKMESVGQLAGGVAHDFNNQLGILLFDVDLLLARVEEVSIREDLKKIRKTVLRAADLTRQLLVFSRRQRMEPQPVDLNHHVGELRKMMGRLLGENIDVVLQLDDQVCIVSADPGNLDQVLINLCVNARDAMPDGGVLTIETRHVVVTQGDKAQGGEPGSYCLLAVHDSGHGMEQDVQERVFEPFFTTKEAGKGTGLGLSVVYGIVEAHGGWLKVDSTPDEGSCFEIYLPTGEGIAAAGKPSEADEEEAGGQGEYVLLVEDDPELRIRMEQVLSGAGYRVTACGDLSGARREHGGARFDLLVSDLVLPDGRGTDLAFELMERSPGMRSIIVTGHTDDSIDWEEARRRSIPILHKPLGMSELLEQARLQLDS